MSDEEGQEEEAETAIPMAMPCKPTQEEIDNHNLSHLPFRSWCKHCVMGRAQSTPHYHRDHTEDKILAIVGAGHEEEILRILKNEK